MEVVPELGMNSVMGHDPRSQFSEVVVQSMHGTFCVGLSASYYLRNDPAAIVARCVLSNSTDPSYLRRLSTLHRLAFPAYVNMRLELRQQRPTTSRQGPIEDYDIMNDDWGNSLYGILYRGS